MELENQSGLAVVGSYLYPHEADLACATLEAHDVPAWVLDAHQVQMRWHLSAALGGVKVAVAPEDAERAAEILREDRSGDLENLPESLEPPHEDERCPRCGVAGDSVDVHISGVSARTILGAIISFVFGFLFPLRTVAVEYVCRSCGATWSKERAR